jgi:hypothetical protein
LVAALSALHCLDGTLLGHFAHFHKLGIKQEPVLPNTWHHLATNTPSRPYFVSTLVLLQMTYILVEEHHFLTQNPLQNSLLLLALIEKQDNYLLKSIDF